MSCCCLLTTVFCLLLFSVGETPLAKAAPHTINQPKTLRSSAITGLGYYVPERVVTNSELETLVDTSDEWIFSRTGIRERHIAAADESTADLAENAARAALRDAGLTPDQVQLIIVATCT